MIQIGDVVEILSGYAFKSNLFNESGEGLPLVRIRDVGKKQSETYYSGEYSDVFLLGNGDFIIGMDGDFRLAKWQGGKALLNQRVCKITPNKEKIDPLYLYYILPKELKKIEDVTSFATVKHLSAKDIKAISIPLPPLAEQQRIAAILDAAESLRQKDQQLVERYTALSQSLFLGMIGDSNLNPRNWKEVLVEEVASNEKHSIKAGPFGSALKKEFYVPKGYKIYGQEQVIKDNLSFGNYYISVEKFKELENCKIKAGDVLISLVGTYGKISVVPNIFEEGIINPRLMKISPNTQIIRPDFLKIMLQSQGVDTQLQNMSRGGTMDIINVGIIRKVKIPLPPIELQNQFAERIQLIEAQKQQATRSLEKSEALFNSLLQRAFTGELTAKMAA